MGNNQNHSLTGKVTEFKSKKTTSRNRHRIVVAATREVGIQPGDRVRLALADNRLTLSVTLDPFGQYKVEKDGAVRFPAHKFGVLSRDIVTQSNQINNKIVVI